MKLLEGLTSVTILPLVLGSRWDKRGIDNVYAGAPGRSPPVVERTAYLRSVPDSGWHPKLTCAVNNITVSSDNLVQCSEATISWTNTKVSNPVSHLIRL